MSLILQIGALDALSFQHLLGWLEKLYQAFGTEIFTGR